MKHLTFLTVLFVVFHCCVGSDPTLLGSISVTSPAFLLISDAFTSSNALIISSFGVSPFTQHGVYVVDDIGAQLNNLSDIQPSLWLKESWPNVVSPVPSTVFSKEVLAIPSGFLVPGVSTGAINLLVNPAEGTQLPVKVSVDDSGFFYHMVEWIDINQDGLLDILTARATKPIFGTASGNLLWYEQPKSNPLSTSWTPHQLLEGPDFFIDLYDIDGDGSEEILSGEFFGEKIVIYYKSPTELWSNVSAISSVTVDSSIGALFKASFVDVNNDGVMDILATNHVNNASLSGVYAYEIPTNYQTQPFIKHTLATGFKTIAKGTGSAAPGSALLFFPTTDSTGKPYIALAGDGNEAAYILTPTQTSPSDWGYNASIIYSGTSTVGGVAAADVNNDGFTELFVALYDSDEIQVFSYSS